MGTTLTGKRVQNTYDSLLKLSNNDNLTGTAQIVTDGLGNDSPIYLSTTRVGIGVSPTYEFQTNSNAKIGGNLIVGGNLTVNGTTTIVDSTVVAIGDNMIEMAKDNVANTMDIGWYGTIVESGTKFIGMKYDAGSGVTTPEFHIGLGTIEPSSTAEWTVKGKLVIGAIDSTGGTFSGQITIPETPTADAHAASKKYVDDQIADVDVDNARRVIITVKNTETIALSKGTVVHAEPTATPPSGNLVEIKKADYDTASLMPAIGILNEDLDAAGGSNDEGDAVMFGFINGIDTSSFSAGDELYVGNDGSLTNSKPLLTTQLIQKIAVVMKVDASNGSIEVFGAGRSNDVPNEVDRDLSIAGNLTVDDYIDVEAASGYGRIEIGGPTGGYIDLKTPFSDDYDLRMIFDSGGANITSSSTLRLNSSNTNAVLIDANQDTTFYGNINLIDGNKIYLGSDSDLEIYHDGTDGYIDNINGELIIQNNSDDKKIIFKSDNGVGGITDYFLINGSINLNEFKISTRHNDNVKAFFGDGSDLQIYHDGSHSYIEDNGTGNFKLFGGSAIQMYKSGTTEIMAQFQADAGVNLYYDNSLKLETTNTGIDVTGDGNFTGNINISSIYPRINLIDTNHNDDWSIINADGSFRVYNMTDAIDSFNINSDNNATFAGNITLGANYIGRDADNYIDFSTDNEIDFKVGGGVEITLDASQLYPVSNFGSSLGKSTNRWDYVYARYGNFSVDLTTPLLTLSDHLVIENGNSTYSVPAPPNTDVPLLYIRNSNNTASTTTAHALITLRTQINGGDPFIAFDVENETGWTAGMDNSDNKFKITTGWSDVGGTTGLIISTLGELDSPYFGAYSNVNSTGDGGAFIKNGQRLGFDESGTRSWTVKAASGQLNFFSGDNNGAAYFYQPTFGISSGSAQNLDLELNNSKGGSTDRVRIKTTANGVQWDLENDQNLTAFKIRYTTGAADVVVLNNGSPANSIVTNSTGVGIGTIPSNKLHVSGRTLIEGSAGYLFDVQTTDTNQPRFQVYVDDTSGVSLISGYNTTPKSMLFYTGGTERMRVTESGEVKIVDNSVHNNTDANNRLHISRNNHAYIKFSTPDNYDQGLHFYNTTDNSNVGRLAYLHSSSGDVLDFVVGGSDVMELLGGGGMKLQRSSDPFIQFEEGTTYVGDVFVDTSENNMVVRGATGHGVRLISNAQSESGSTGITLRTDNKVSVNTTGGYQTFYVNGDIGIPGTNKIVFNNEPTAWYIHARTTTSTSFLGTQLKNLINCGGGANEGFAIGGVGTGDASFEVKNDGTAKVKSRLAVGGNSLYGDLEVTCASKSFGEGIILNPDPTYGWSALFWRLQGATGSTYTGTWFMGKQWGSADGAGECLQVGKEGLTGGALLDAKISQRWYTNGNVGFGFKVAIGTSTTTPSQALHVAGNIYVEDGTGGLGVILENGDRPMITRGWDAFTSGSYTGIGRWGLFMQPATTFLASPGTDYSNGLVSLGGFTASGTAQYNLTVNNYTRRVGIGTTTPSHTLTIGSGQSNFIRLHNASSGDVSSGILIERGTATGLQIYDNPADNASTFLAAGMINFRTNGSQRIRIDTAGRVGINESSPATDSILSMTSGYQYGLQISHNKANASSDFNDCLFIKNTNSNNSNYVAIGMSTNGTDGQHHRVQIRAYKGTTGNYEGQLRFHMRQTNATNLERYRFYANGEFHADSDIVAFSTTISDKRLKDDVITIDSALDKVKQLRGVEYVWNSGSKKGKKDLGVIAQEVEEILPEIVTEKEMAFFGEEKYKTVDYEKLTAVLIESVKELSAKVEALENKKCNCNYK